EIRGHVLTLVLSALIPATFFVWLVSDHFQASSVLEFHSGWAQNDGEFKMPFFRFWFFNFGILVPLAFTLIGLIAWQVYQSREARRFELSAVLAIGLGAFVLACWRIGRHALSWRWAVVIFLALIVLPLFGRQLIAQWELPMRAAVCFALFASGFVSLFGGLAAGKDGFGFANRGEVDAVGFAVRKMPLESRFAAWPTYNHPLLLDGR